MLPSACLPYSFLSIQAQDFIEDRKSTPVNLQNGAIPEHSSSGLH